MIYLILIIALIFFVVALTKKTKTSTENMKAEMTHQQKKEQEAIEKRENSHSSLCSEFIQIYVKNEKEYEKNIQLKRMFSKIVEDPNTISSEEVEKAIQMIINPQDETINEMDKLLKLAELKKAGAISDDEFNLKKQELMAKI